MGFVTTLACSFAKPSSRVMPARVVYFVLALGRMLSCSYTVGAYCDDVLIPEVLHRYIRDLPHPRIQFHLRWRRPETSHRGVYVRASV